MIDTRLAIAGAMTMRRKWRCGKTVAMHYLGHDPAPCIEAPGKSASLLFDLRNTQCVAFRLSLFMACWFSMKLKWKCCSV